MAAGVALRGRWVFYWFVCDVMITGEREAAGSSRAEHFVYRPYDIIETY